MIPGAQLLTAPTSLANYKPEDLSSTARSLISSSFIFLQVSPDLREEERMAAPPSRPRSRTSDETELWFSMPSRVRHDETADDHLRIQEESAYHATSSRHSATRSASPSRFPSIPLISTPAAVNKPLPPSPSCERKKRKPASLRNLIRRRPSNGGLDPAHLQPKSYQHQRSSSGNGNLSPEPYQHYYSSRSMPNSPLEYTHTHSAPNPATMQRAHSAAAHYTEAMQYAMQYEPYSLQPQSQHHPRTVSMETYFEPTAPRARRTFPESGRDSMSDRHRPHTWLSPTEPFADDSEFHLFAEATSGLPDGFDPTSPNGAPHVQASLFARGRQNDRIPLPMMHDRSATQPPQVHDISGWHHYEWAPRHQSVSQDLSLSSSALPRRDSYAAPASPRMPNMNSINLELERLGLADQEQPDDELPDYAQSQAEMSEKKRKEAAARARELEARWNSSRGWRNR